MKKDDQFNRTKRARVWSGLFRRWRDNRPGTRRQSEVPLFRDVRTAISLQYSVGHVEESLCDRIQPDTFICFETIPACDRQTDRQTGSTGAGLAPRSRRVARAKNLHVYVVYFDDGMTY